jgi:competence protein ComEA
MKKLILVIILLFSFSGIAFAVVNINTATQTELESLQGIGPAKARAIIEHREKKGAFASKDDLKNVNGIGAGTVKQLREGITVGVKPAEKKVADKK